MCKRHRLLPLGVFLCLAHAGPIDCANCDTIHRRPQHIISLYYASQFMACVAYENGKLRTTNDDNRRWFGHKAKRFKWATLSDEIVIKSKEENILLVIRIEYRSSWQYLTNKRATRKQLRTRKQQQPKTMMKHAHMHACTHAHTHSVHGKQNGIVCNELCERALIY